MRIEGTDNNFEFYKKLFQEISEKVFDCIAVIRAEDKKLIFINEKGAVLFGYECPEEMANTSGLTLRKNIPNAEMLAKIDREISTKGYFSDEVEFLTRNKESFWGLMQLSRLSADGANYHLLKIERTNKTKSYTESLIKENQRFGALMDYASIGVIIVNRQLKIVLMNSSTLHLSGYTKKEMLGTDIVNLTSNPFQGNLKNHLSNHFTGVESNSSDHRLELPVVRKDSSTFAAEVSIGDFRIGEENFAILFINDITRRKEGEDEIKKLNAELERNVMERTNELDTTIIRLEEQILENEKNKAELVKVTQYQEAVLDSSGAMIIATDQHGIINLFNKAAENLLGYHKEEIIGKYTPILFHDDEEIQKGALQYSKELGKAILPGFEVFVAKSREDQVNKKEWIYVKKDGTPFPVSLSITAFRNQRNEITGFLGVAVDISETKETERELKKALAREIELNEMKSRFVSIASHEFRTPLSTILSSTYLLQKYTQTEQQAKREKHTNRIISSVVLLTDLLDELLSVGKIEEGMIAPKYSHFNIKTHIEKDLDEMKSILKKNQLINYHHSGSQQVRLDSGMLTHITINLLSNAIKFSPEFTTISIDSCVSDSLLEIKVKDQGIGISKEDQGHLFERFFRSGNAADIQGTGLGLYIVQKYTELMNGTIECSSGSGQGTEFLIKIEMRGL